MILAIKIPHKDAVTRSFHFFEIFWHCSYSCSTYSEMDLLFPLVIFFSQTLYFNK